MVQFATYLSAQQVARLGIGIGENSLRRLIKSGRCPGFYVGKHFRIDVDELIRMLKAGEIDVRNV